MSKPLQSAIVYGAGAGAILSQIPPDWKAYGYILVGVLFTFYVRLALHVITKELNNGR